MSADLWKEPPLYRCCSPSHTNTIWLPLARRRRPHTCTPHGNTHEIWDEFVLSVKVSTYLSVRSKPVCELYKVCYLVFQWETHEILSFPFFVCQRLRITLRFDTQNTNFIYSQHVQDLCLKGTVHPSSPPPEDIKSSSPPQVVSWVWSDVSLVVFRFSV